MVQRKEYNSKVYPEKNGATRAKEKYIPTIMHYHDLAHVHGPHNVAVKSFFLDVYSIQNTTSSTNRTVIVIQTNSKKS